MKRKSGNKAGLIAAVVALIAVVLALAFFVLRVIFPDTMGNLFGGKKSESMEQTTEAVSNTENAETAGTSVQESAAASEMANSEAAAPGESDAGNAEGTEGAVPAAGSLADCPVPAAAGLIVQLNAMDEIPVPATKEDALAYASAYATEYDYDRAMQVIQMIEGYEGDADLMGAVNQYQVQKDACVAVDVRTVAHIFFHSLLNDDRGLRADVVGQGRSMANNTAMATSDEFLHVMQDMYNAGYVMISLYDMVDYTINEDGTISTNPNENLMLPEGKKAFVLSEDDLSYYHSYGIGTQGYATKMVIDGDGMVKCEYTNENGETLIGNYDVVPLMDAFIEEHPDFVYKGARGTVALTGYNGVFGYRTNDYYKDINNEHLDSDQVQWLRDHPDFNWDQDVADATKIANAMKAMGWTFASHTYGHWNAARHTAEQLQSDNERWMTVNHPIVGDIDIIIFAFGADIGPANGYTADNPKFTYFKSQGYNIFCNVDGNIGWTEFGPDYMRTGRVAIDGFTMYQAMAEDGKSHATYKHAYDVLGITDIASFFNPNRQTPIESE